MLQSFFCDFQIFLKKIIQDIIVAYSVFCDLKKIAKNANIRSSQKLPYIRYWMMVHMIYCISYWLPCPYLKKKRTVKCYTRISVEKMKFWWYLKLDPPDCQRLFLRGGSVHFLFENIWTLAYSQHGRFQRKYCLNDSYTSQHF